MNEKFILNVFDKFEKSSAVLLHIKEGDAELTLKKEAAYQQRISTPIALATGTHYMQAQGDSEVQTASAAPQVTLNNGALPATTGMNGSLAGGSAGAADNHLVTVKSPIVGSFYRSPSPDAPAYVDKGTKVSKGQPLCILEAMKMMNTLECEYDGTIEDILAANGDLVEFDQPLFVIRV